MCPDGSLPSSFATMMWVMTTLLVLMLVCHLAFAPFAKPPSMPAERKYGPTDETEIICIATELMMMIGAYFVFRNQVTTPAKVAIGLAALVALAGPLIHARMLKKKHPEWWADDEDKSDDTENPLAKGKTKDEKEME